MFFHVEEEENRNVCPDGTGLCSSSEILMQFPPKIQKMSKTHMPEYEGQRSKCRRSASFPQFEFFHPSKERRAESDVWLPSVETPAAPRSHIWSFVFYFSAFLHHLPT